jgi:hypothetical protein
MMGAAPEQGAALQVEIDVVLQLNSCDRRLDPGGHNHLPSSVARTGVDGFLDGSGVRTDVVTGQAIIHYIIDARSLVHGRSGGGKSLPRKCQQEKDSDHLLPGATADNPARAPCAVAPVAR